MQPDGIGTPVIVQSHSKAKTIVRLPQPQQATTDIARRVQNVTARIDEGSYTMQSADSRVAGFHRFSLTPQDMAREEL